MESVLSHWLHLFNLINKTKCIHRQPITRSIEDRPCSQGKIALGIKMQATC